MSQNEAVGAILGGVAGGVIGNQFGKTAATVLGAVIGAAVGRNIGRSFDETSPDRAGEAIHEAPDTAEVGESVTWENPGNADGPATVTRQEADREGRTSREFPQTVTIEGREEQSCGTACRNDSGDWQTVSS